MIQVVVEVRKVRVGVETTGGADVAGGVVCVECELEEFQGKEGCVKNSVGER